MPVADVTRHVVLVGGPRDGERREVYNRTRALSIPRSWLMNVMHPDGTVETLVEHAVDVYLRDSGDCFTHWDIYMHEHALEDE